MIKFIDQEDTVEVILENNHSYTFWIVDGVARLGRFSSDLFGEASELEKDIARKLINERLNKQ